MPAWAQAATGTAAVPRMARMVVNPRRTILSRVVIDAVPPVGNGALRHFRPRRISRALARAADADDARRGREPAPERDRVSGIFFLDARYIQGARVTEPQHVDVEGAVVAGARVTLNATTRSQGVVGIVGVVSWERSSTCRLKPARQR
jgi:hypothetical protein